MELRRLGASDLQIPPIIFGAWAIGGWLWGGTDDREAIAAIEASVDEGLFMIDTAPVYGFGHSEELVGKAIRGKREKVIIATKCGPRIDRTDGVFSMNVTLSDGTQRPLHRILKPDSIVEECERSLRRLGVDLIDLYQCHWPDYTTPVADTMGALVRLREQGKIRCIGVSNYSWERINESLHYGQVVSDQPRYNLIKRDIEAELLPWCRDHSVGIICYSSMEHGLLSGKVTMERAFPDDDLRSKHPWFKPENRRRVIEVIDRTLRPMAENHRATVAQVAINWVFNEPGVTAAIVGARNPKQVRENAGALGFTLSADERAQMRTAFESLGAAR